VIGYGKSLVAMPLGGHDHLFDGTHAIAQRTVTVQIDQHGTTLAARLLRKKFGYCHNRSYQVPEETQEAYDAAGNAYALCHRHAVTLLIATVLNTSLQTVATRCFDAVTGLLPLGYRNTILVN